MINIFFVSLCIPFPLYNRQNFWFLPCIFVSLFRFAIFWRVSDFKKSNLSVFPTGWYTAFSSRLCTLGMRLPDWSIYSLTCKSSMFDHHFIVVLLEVGNGRTSSETDVRFFLFCTVKNEFCTVQLNYICNLIV